MPCQTASPPGHAHRIIDDDIDYTVFSRRPLSDEGLRTLRYLREVNRYLTAWLHDAASAARSDRSTMALLAQCALEKASHGEVLDKLVSTRPAAAAFKMGQHHSEQPSRLRFTPWWHAFAARLTSRDSLAMSIALAAVNEWFVYAAYRRLLELQRHPELSQVIGRIQRQEIRQVDFCATQAHVLLDLSCRARLGTRLALQMGGLPITAAPTPARETAFLVRYLMGGPEGTRMIQQIDKKIDRLPGLAGLRPLTRLAATYQVGSAAGVHLPRGRSARPVSGPGLGYGPCCAARRFTGKQPPSRAPWALRD
jgi:hypothetical protein